MPAPKEIIDLVARFEAHREEYCAPGFNEAQLRIEFLNPLLKALHWDVDNERNYAQTYREVIHEASVKVGEATKAPDYSLRIGGQRKLFVEAKKPAVNLKDLPEPAFQLRRYAWSAQLPLSILTNFREFAVYDTRIKPDQRDKAGVARVMYLTCEEYAEKWEEIAALFDREAIPRGALDRYAEDNKRKRGTAQVDEEFLKEIEGWREQLALNLALRNPDLSARDLNFSVQATIDRIIFLRIAEDRGIEPYGRLNGLIKGEGTYSRLARLFVEADNKYNSGLFHFRKEKGRFSSPDDLSLKLKVDDKVVKSVLSGLYYPESPYEFSVISADILGQVYEQFLGKVIRLTTGHRAKVEEKPEVRKAGGVYYTPTYIVNYIVSQTVGPLLEERGRKSAPKEGEESPIIGSLKILDPSCGSGSFLLGAYQHLLDWHLNWYSFNNPARWCKGRNPRLVATDGKKGDFRLSLSERRRILLEHIHGVDIDPQAVEVTKLSLLLKVLEGDPASLAHELSIERALPDLDSNIQCGNSLIGADYYSNRPRSLWNEEEQYVVNAFDWHVGFKQIMHGGGFDAILGNPPYVRVRIFKQFHPDEAAYLESSYKCATHVWDIYLLFYEKALELARPGGIFGFIVPIQTLHQPNCESLRSLLLSKSSLRTITDLSRLKVFKGATVKNCILTFEKRLAFDSDFIDIQMPGKPDDLITPVGSRWPLHEAMTNPGHSLKVDLLSPHRSLCRKLEKRSDRLGDKFYVTFGLRSSAPGKAQGGKERLITTSSKAAKAKPYLEGRDIERYLINPTERYIRYIPSEMYSPRSPELFETPKIVSQTMLSKKRIIAALDTSGYYPEQSLLCIVPHGIVTESVPGPIPPLEYVLGVLNSRLTSYYFSTAIIDYSLGGGLIHATPGSQAKLLVPHASKKEIERLIRATETIQELKQQFAKAKSPHDQQVLQRQIEAADGQIDRLVYELYELTEEEIAIVEGRTE